MQKQENEKLRKKVMEQDELISDIFENKKLEKTQGSWQI